MSSSTVPNTGGAFIADVVTGRLCINGIEMGDTGWRAVAKWTAGVQDVTAGLIGLNTAAWTPSGTGQIAIRRVGNMVSVAISNLMVAVTGSGDALLASNLPAGFAFSSVPFSPATGSLPRASNIAIQNPFSVQPTLYSSVVLTAGTFMITGDTSGKATTAVAVVNSSVWPTTLPGIVAAL